MKHNHEGHEHSNGHDHGDNSLVGKEHVGHAYHETQVEEGIHDDRGPHDEHEGHGHHHHGNFKELLFKSLPLGIIVMLMTPLPGVIERGLITFSYSDVVAALVATVLIIYGGRPFFTGAVSELKKGAPGMMALVSLGVGVAYLYSVYAVISRYTTGEFVMDFFFEFASLLLIMLLGHWIEMKAVGEAGDAQKALAELVPKDAHVVLEDDSIDTRPVADLKIGDIVRVQAGENIPADGIITRGESRVNEALLTGESKPVKKSVGDEAIGGSTNGESVLYVEIKETGDQSFISQVQTLISQAQSQPSRAENIAQKVAGWLFYVAVIAATLAFFYWAYTVDPRTAIVFAVTTMVIACPHALGLAIPLVVARSTTLGASRGLLVKDRDALETARNAEVMILDKTGTLTTGEFKVLTIKSLNENYTEDEISALMAGIESGSSHPIAQSITRYAEQHGARPVSFDSIDVVSGAGVEGYADSRKYQLISQKVFGDEIAIDVPKGATLSILVEDGEAIGTVALGDELKEKSKELMQVLKDNNIQPIMATGDNEKAAQGVAEILNIEYRANQSPQDKYDLVESLKNQGKIVIMVGDGVNDAPSLAMADVGVAIGAGTQVAIDSADVILTQSDPGDIEAFIELANKTTRKMKQNLIWGAGYNVFAIPIAAGVLAPIGITITPAVAAILMSMSTVIVAINAMTLKLKN